MSMTDAQRKQWKQELMRDYPLTEPYFIDLVLDLYKFKPDYVKKLNKKKFNAIEQETPKEIVGAISVVDGNDESFIKKYFQEPIYLPPEDEETSKEDEKENTIKNLNM
jgi:hypothetical protein